MLEINKIYNEDCLIGMQDIPNESVDCVICDLPYGVTNCKWDSVLPLDELWAQYERIIKPNGAIVLFGQEPFSSIVRVSRLSLYRYDWVWQKERPSNFQLMGFQNGRVHENIMVFSKAKACFVKNGDIMKYNPQTTEREKVRVANKNTMYGNNILHKYKGSAKEGEKKEYKDRQPTSIIKFNGVSKKLHPTQKPLELIQYLIRTYTDIGDLVLDNCIGSGTTAIACIKEKRNFIGFELDSKYFDIASRRIADYKRQPTIF